MATLDRMSDPGLERFLRELGVHGPVLLHGLEGLEWAWRRLHPPALPRLRAALAPWRDRVTEARARLSELPAPEGLEGLREGLLAAADPLAEALDLLAGDAEGASVGPAGIARVLGAMRAHCRAQEALFALRLALPPVARFFVEAPFRGDLAVLDPEPPPGVAVGLLRGRDAVPGRGGFSLFVPGRYDPDRSWPLVVALHGGGGDGRDFVWTWLREARGRGFLLLAPTSRGPTWSFNGPDVDAPALAAMVDAVCARYRVDRERMLLTGLSDGATYTLHCGLQEGMPFTALAPLSGVLHPASLANGSLERARGRRIRLVHGALDWMFPVAVARAARDALAQAGADLVYREIEDLSHAYAREENDAILSWFDPSLALPSAPQGELSSSSRAGTPPFGPASG